ncbi:hypothetical protein DM02DRAFT_541662 [Periconia macrospinosa]|uniref:Uncharacterized protein n=1 Tax=Periconia macrospinosa TaxID=97972 RepID=A0A2V1D5P9_9PLEO|nr:hypothetical protein DM02DRAFT_541662 [Periconia macrospinosa]
MEVLQHIVVCVGTHRPSLYAFTLTSKACHQAAIFLVFREIIITMYDRDRLQRDVNSLVAALSHTDSFRHIRRITIKGELKRKAERLEGDNVAGSWLDTTWFNEVLEDEEPVHWTGRYEVYDEGVIEKSSEEDMGWSPIVKLLQAQISLEDLVWDCQNQFPPSLLRALDEHPRCRLHHLTFRFRTLLWGEPYSYEMELATSPSLYRVKVPCSTRDNEGDDDFNLEAIMELVAGLAPNLKEVAVLNLLPARYRSFTRPRELWQGLPGFTGGVGSLTSLSLKGVSRLDSATTLQNWARYTDFTRLKKLTLGGSYKETTSGLSGETMEWVAAQIHVFSQVTTLSVYLTRNDFWQAKPHYSDHAVSFFQAFQSLEELSISGPMDSKIVDTVLTHHGQTLKKLSLRPFEEQSSESTPHDRRDIPFEFTMDWILQIEAQCPILEELAIPVKRKMSSASEVNIYRSLGRMKTLRSLFIIMECSNWRVTRDSAYNPKLYIEEDQESLPGPASFLTRGELKETFVNCAVDEALARSIWETICQSKTGRPLERLKLWPSGGGEYGQDIGPGLPPTVDLIIRGLARSWIIERIPRDDKEEFIVREITQHKRIYSLDFHYSVYFHDPEIWKILRSSRIWRPKPGRRSKDWREDWSSFPLQIYGWCFD